MQACTFCGGPPWAEGSGISICRSCAARLGRLIIITDTESLPFWRRENLGAASSDRRAGDVVDVPLPAKELGLDISKPEEFIQKRGTLQMRMAGLGFFASSSLRSLR